MEADEMRDDPLSGNVGFWYLENEYNSFPLVELPTLSKSYNDISFS